MNKDQLHTLAVEFRDRLKEYQGVVKEMWEARRSHEGEKITSIREERETPLREELTNRLGQLEKHFQKIGLTMSASFYQRTFPIFDTALDPKIFDNPIKGESLNMAVQMAIKAVGIIESLEDIDVRQLEKKTPTVFVSYNFAKENESLVSTIISFLETQGVAIIVGSEPGTGSVSEKVKTMIDDSDIVIGIMTKDEQDADKNWSASKWIRDELAYGLADSKRIVIRMIEEGCDTAGRIFGDSEYISFNRDNPSDAIVKLAAMLQKTLRH